MSGSVVLAPASRISRQHPTPQRSALRAAAEAALRARKKRVPVVGPARIAHHGGIARRQAKQLVKVVPIAPGAVPSECPLSCSIGCHAKRRTLSAVISVARSPEVAVARQMQNVEAKLSNIALNPSHFAASRRLQRPQATRRGSCTG